VAAAQNWTTFRKRIPPPKKRVVIWVPRLATWEAAALAGQSFTLLSGPNAGTVVNWREVSHYMIVEPPKTKGETNGSGSD
jgi:hypothetical protein